MLTPSVTPEVHRATEDTEGVGWGGGLRERAKCWQTVSFQFKHMSALESACGALVEPRVTRAASSAGTECRALWEEALGDCRWDKSKVKLSQNFVANQVSESTVTFKPTEEAFWLEIYCRKTRMGTESIPVGLIPIAKSTLVLH